MVILGFSFLESIRRKKIIFSKHENTLKVQKNSFCFRSETIVKPLSEINQISIDKLGVLFNSDEK